MIFFSISIVDWVVLVLGIVFILAGFIGCVLPIIPGPPISYLSLIILLFSSAWDVSTSKLLIYGFLTVFVTILDYVVPIYGTKKFGGTKYGTWGAVLGLIIGLLIGPIGIILGPFFGAFIGEMLGGQNSNNALRAGFGSFLGFLTGTILKMFVSVLIAIVFIKSVL